MNENIARTCYICGGPITGKLFNWKGHDAHEECAKYGLSGVPTVPPNEDTDCQPLTCGKVFTTGEICTLEQNRPGPCSYTMSIVETFRRRLRDDPDVHMLNLARTLKMEGFTWCRVATEIIGRINRAEKKLEEIGYRRDGEHWLPLKVESAEQVKPGDPIPPGWVHQTVYVDPAFDNADKSIAGVMLTFPAELIGPDCPDAGKILKEIQFVAELLLTKNRAYGSSFRKVLGVFSKLSPVEAINARMDDKLARMQQAKDFSEDTELDLIGYLILKRVVQRELQTAMKVGETSPEEEDEDLRRKKKGQCSNTTPSGYWCRRDAGHTGPCAFVPPTSADGLPNGESKEVCGHNFSETTKPCHLPAGHAGPHRYHSIPADAAPCKHAPGPSSPVHPDGPATGQGPSPATSRQ